MNTCKDCKWWDAYHKDDPANSFGMCRAERFAEDVQAVVKSPIEGEWPADGKYDGFDTAPDFGCIHWEKKNE